MNICRTEKRTEQFNVHGQEHAELLILHVVKYSRFSIKYCDSRIREMELVFKCELFTVKLFYSNDFIWGFFFVKQKFNIRRILQKQRPGLSRNIQRHGVQEQKKLLFWVVTPCYNYICFTHGTTLTSVQQSQGRQDQEWCLLPRELVHDAPKRRPN